MNEKLSISTAKLWKTALLFGGLHFLIMTYGAFVIEPTDCQFVVPAYFMALPAMLSILRLRRFGAGTIVFLPYAIIGFFPVYYMDYVTLKTMLTVWGAVAWCLGGVLSGLAADLAFRFLPQRFSEKQRAILTGVVVGLGIYLTPLVAMTFFYAPQPPESHYYLFTKEIVYTLSWLLVNGGFAGYTAYAIQKRV
ncbi:MAG: hypothetical protein AB1894_09770 [Chloroflexota bacterium]